MRTTTVFTIVMVVGFVTCTVREGRAEVATQQEMELVCQHWLSQTVHQRGGWAGEAEPKIAKVQDIVASDGHTLLARCYSIVPRGHVVVPVLKALPPVKASSEEYDLDVNQTVGFPQLLREVLEHRISLYIKTYGSLEAAQPRSGRVLFDPVNRQEWDRFLLENDRLEADLAVGAMDPLTEVGPLLTTDWHQYSPYYNSCPYGDGGQTLVGCVATAAAQVMNYHQWPPNGVGNHTYYWYGDYSCDGSTPGQLLYADFSDTYDWANMPDDCSGGCSSAQQDALAELCYEVGVAYGMDYGACGSGTYTHYALSVLPTYFRYDPAIDREDRPDHSAESWFDLVKAEINADRPILYRISRHAIVCDGWRDTGGLNQYHMNYGWGGSYTTWFTVDNLHCDWEGCDPMVEFMIRNIEPWQPADPDCNNNSVPDYQDIWGSTSEDCNGNATPDECDIIGVTSDDCQPDSVPDECQIVGLVVPSNVGPCAPTANNGDPWCEDFEGYSLGSIQGINGWQGWGPGSGDPSAAGIVTTEQNHTVPGSKSLKIADHDTVRLFEGYDYGASQSWILSAWIFVPSTMTGGAYFIVLADYDGGGAGTRWAITLEMGPAIGVIFSQDSGTFLPLITDTWVEIRAEISFQQDSVAVFYDGALLATHAWTSHGGSLNVAAVDLWGPESDGFYYDDLSLLPAVSADCNENDVPDDCDIAGPTSDDVNANGVPDECDCPPADPPVTPPGEAGFEKMRYISLVPGSPGQQTALRVTLATLPAPFAGFSGTQCWVGEPQSVSENAGKINHEPGWPDFMSANLQGAPHCMDWSTVGVLHVTDDDIIPGAVYDVQAIDCICNINDPANYSPPLTITTSGWGDLVRDCTTCPCGAPDGTVGIVTDVTAALDKFKNLRPPSVLCDAVIKPRADVEPNFPDWLVNISDVTQMIDAFRGCTYSNVPRFPFCTVWSGPDGCP